MAARNYDLDRQDVAAGNVGTEIALLSAAVDGEVLSVERISIYCSDTVGFAIRRYVNSVQVFEWHTATGVAGETVQSLGPWNLIGSSAAPQELRYQRLSGTGSNPAMAYFSRE